MNDCIIRRFFSPLRFSKKQESVKKGGALVDMHVLVAGGLVPTKIPTAERQ